MQVDAYTSADEDQLAAFVREHAAGLPCHMPAWRAAVAATYGGRDISLVARGEEGSIVGVLPLWERGGHAVSSPHGNCAGPLVGGGCRDDVLPSLLDAVESLGLRSAQVRAIEGELGEGRGVLNEGRSVFSLDVSQGADAALGAADSTARNRKRKAESSGLAVQRGGKRLPAFYELYVASMRRHGTPSHPLRLFEALAERFGGDFDVLLAGMPDAPPAAGQILIRCGRTLSYPWQADDPGQRHLCPNDLLVWGCIERAAELGCAAVDTGRSVRGSSQARFKHKWGGRERRLVTWPRAARHMARYALLSAVWEWLPLGMARRLGPIVRRRIP